MENPPDPFQTAQDNPEAYDHSMLPSLAAITQADETATAIERRTKNEGSLPFPSTRLRAYSSRIEDLAESYQEPEPQVDVETSKTDAPAYPVHSGHGSPEKFTGASNLFPPLEQHSPGAAPPASVDLNAPISPQMYNVAIAELHGLRSEISRVEATLQSLKEPQERSTLGRPIYKKNPMRANPVRRKDTFAERRKEWESQQLLTATQPVSRGEAVILEQTLEELLPAGVVTKSLKKKGGPSFDVHTFEKQYELVDMVLREAARQVHAGCHERGSVLEKLRMRYNEFFSAMKALLFKLHQNFSNNAADLQVAQTQAQDAVKDRDHLADENIKLKSDCEFLQGRVGALEKDFSQHKSAAEEALLNLKTNNQMLERELQHYEERLTKSEAEREQAVSLAVASLEDELSSIIDERDDLTQRIRFLERQLAKAREDRQRAVPVDHAATQTDIEEVVDDDGSDMDDDLEEDELEGRKSSQRRKRRKGRDKRNKAQSTSRGGGEERERSQTSKARLGGFDNLLKSDRVGRIKPKGQICKIISQIYCEKITVDQVDDREGNPRTPLAEFCYDWHLNRYGLRNLAEMNLLDLIASVKHYAKECLKMKLFAQFCNLAGEGMHTLEHLNFYLYCMQVISSNVSMLFPDTDDMIYWLKPLRVLDIIRVIYPSLADNSMLRDFMAARVEALMDPKAKMYDADAVLDLLLDEWHRRAERNIAHLKALFRAGDADEDGLLTYDEFLSVVRHADSLRAEREIVRMYRECLLISGDGETVDVDSFVSVGRTHGLSNWKIDYNISEVTGKKTPVVAGDNDVTKENLFSMLDSALASSENLEDQIQILKSKLGESHETVLRASKQHNFFQMKYKERDDAEGTWLAYRVLIGEVRAAMIRYKGGLKRIVGLVKSSIAFMNRDRANSSYTSPLQNMLQQSKDEGGVRPSGFGGVAEGEEGGALIPNSAPPIVAGGDSQAVEATTALNMLKGQNEAGTTAELPPSET